MNYEQEKLELNGRCAELSADLEAAKLEIERLREQLKKREFSNHVIVRKQYLKQLQERAVKLPPFSEAWDRKESEGYQYGDDALENVEFGYAIAKEELERLQKGTAE